MTNNLPIKLFKTKMSVNITAQLRIYWLWRKKKFLKTLFNHHIIQGVISNS